MKVASEETVKRLIELTVAGLGERPGLGDDGRVSAEQSAILSLNVKRFGSLITGTLYDAMFGEGTFEGTVPYDMIFYYRKEGCFVCRSGWKHYRSWRDTEGDSSEQYNEDAEASVIRYSTIFIDKDNCAWVSGAGGVGLEPLTSQALAEFGSRLTAAETASSDAESAASEAASQADAAFKTAQSAFSTAKSALASSNNAIRNGDNPLSDALGCHVTRTDDSKGATDLDMKVNDFRLETVGTDAGGSGELEIHKGEKPEPPTLYQENGEPVDEDAVSGIVVTSDSAVNVYTEGARVSMRKRSFRAGADDEVALTSGGDVGIRAGYAINLVSDAARIKLGDEYALNGMEISSDIIRLKRLSGDGATLMTMSKGKAEVHADDFKVLANDPDSESMQSSISARKDKNGHDIVKLRASQTNNITVQDGAVGGNKVVGDTTFKDGKVAFTDTVDFSGATVRGLGASAPASGDEAACGVCDFGIIEVSPMAYGGDSETDPERWLEVIEAARDGKLITGVVRVTDAPTESGELDFSVSRRFAADAIDTDNLIFDCLGLCADEKGRMGLATLRVRFYEYFRSGALNAILYDTSALETFGAAQLGSEGAAGTPGAAKTELFIDMWNAACGWHGGYYPAGAPDASHRFLLNEVWHTYEEALYTYKYGISPLGLPQGGYYGDTSLRTLLIKFTTAGAGAVVTPNFLSSMPNVETICFSTAQYIATPWAFTGLPKLRKVLGEYHLQKGGSWAFGGSELLEDLGDIHIYESMDFRNCPRLTLQSLQKLVNNAANSGPITVTMHAEAFARLTDALIAQAGAKMISFAEA